MDWIEMAHLGTWVLAVLVGGLFSALTQSLRDVAIPKMQELMAARGDVPVRSRVTRIIEDLEGHATAVALPRVVFNLIAVVAMVMLAKSSQSAGSTVAASSRSTLTGA